MTTKAQIRSLASFVEGVDCSPAAKAKLDAYHLEHGPCPMGAGRPSATPT